MNQAERMCERSQGSPDAIHGVRQSRPQGQRPWRWSSAVMLLALAALLSTPTWGKTVVRWDFTQGAQGWQGNQHVKNPAATGEGLAFDTTGNDPWIEGPAVDLPGAAMTRVKVRLKSDADGAGELFYGPRFQAGRSVRFSIRADGRWHDYALVIPDSLGQGTRFRLDPATSEGHIVVASIDVETLPSIQPPPFENPRRPRANAAEPLSVTSGALALEHYRGGWGDFVLKVNGAEMAAGYRGERIGVMVSDRPEWLELGQSDFSCEPGAEGEIACRAVLRDSTGARWQITRRFRAGTQADTLLVMTEVAVDQDRDIVYLPWLTLFPGLGTFGERKAQGLFAGLEYLDDEPSSSEADITTPEHVRRVPDPVKITFPVMALAQDGRYVGLIWEPSEMVAAVFDSPDRLVNSGAHLMALTAPAVGERRFENSPAAHTPFTLRANQPLRIRATIIGGSSADFTQYAGECPKSRVFQSTLQTASGCGGG